MPDLEEVRTVTADGRVIIPWVIQNALGLEHGGPVQFSVRNGVVTLSAVAPRSSETALDADSPAAGRTGIRAVLAAELKTVLEAAERDRAHAAARNAGDAPPRRTDFQTTLAAELKAVLEAAERTRAKETATL
jgi:bifunctional DNA-binding transcriptional regulator/antitoxin component of YhaV-PrlF toxin-antitoxin module